MGTKTGFLDGYVSSGIIGVPLRTGEEFALTVEYSCDFDIEYRFGTAQTMPSSTMLSYSRSYVGSSGSEPSPEGQTLTSNVYYDQRVVLRTVP